MKRIPLYLLLIFLGGAIGCTPKSIPPPAAPEGYFSGQFMLIRLHPTTGMYDTVKTNLNISMALATGYKVTGDTLKVHAGSFGAYAVSANNYIQFADSTYPANGWPTKIHLAGIYRYYYDGTTFQLLYTFPYDTLSYRYNFKKVN